MSVDKQKIEEKKFIFFSTQANFISITLLISNLVNEIFSIYSVCNLVLAAFCTSMGVDSLLFGKDVADRLNSKYSGTKTDQRQLYVCMEGRGTKRPTIVNKKILPLFLHGQTDLKLGFRSFLFRILKLSYFFFALMAYLSAVARALV